MNDAVADATSGAVAVDARRRAPAISIVTPTFNERANLRPLADAIGAALGAVDWELLVVDDDSPDRTWEEAARLARDGLPVRCIRRVGRRGLASAVVEGALAAYAPVLAVIDADMQHDERLLPRMLSIIETSDADLVIGSRYVAGGSLGAWSARRRRMSALGTRVAALLVGTTVTDPMSGFFAIRRAAFDAALYDLSQHGYKILLDIMASSPAPLRVVELPYTFRDRRAGESKLDASIIAEFAFLLVEKGSNGLVSPRLVLFLAVNGVGLALHLAVLGTCLAAGARFLAAQGVATAAAVTLNFALNNAVTYRDLRLRGRALATGYLVFCAACSTGVVANISVADLALHSARAPWSVAGIAGALVSAVFNFGVANELVWRPRRRGGLRARLART